MSPAEVKELSQEFLDSVCAIPDGERIKECIQCGTCSASCPSAEAMQYSPREIIAALRAGMLDRVLDSNTVWLCVSCYSCTVRCPAGIPFTDVMYELKRLGVEKGLSKETDATAMAKAFVETVDRHGRNAEAKLLRKYYLRTNPLKGLAQIPLAMKLAFRGRMKFRTHKIKGLDQLHKMMATIEENSSFNRDPTASVNSFNRDPTASVNSFNRDPTASVNSFNHATQRRAETCCTR